MEAAVLLCGWACVVVGRLGKWHTGVLEIWYGAWTGAGVVAVRVVLRTRGCVVCLCSYATKALFLPS